MRRTRRRTRREEEGGDEEGATGKAAPSPDGVRNKLFLGGPGNPRSKSGKGTFSKNSLGDDRYYRVIIDFPNCGLGHSFILSERNEGPRFERECLLRGEPSDRGAR